jgi:hypothetical protein
MSCPGKAVWNELVCTNLSKALLPVFRCI